MTEFKDDKNKPMEERILAALDYYYSDGEPFEDDELLDKLDWQRGEEYSRTASAFYPVLEKLENENIIREKVFDTGEGFDIVVYWKNNRRIENCIEDENSK